MTSHTVLYSTDVWQRKNVGEFGESLLGDSPNFTLKINDVHYKESKQAGIHRSFTRQMLLTGNSPNILAIWYMLKEQ